MQREAAVDEKGDARSAIKYCTQAIVAAPQERLHREKLLALIKSPVQIENNATLRKAIQICIEAQDMDCSELWALWYNVLISMPDFSAVYKNAFAREKMPAAPVNCKPLLDPYFLAGLRRFTVYGSTVFEDFLTHLRAYLLFELDKNTIAEADYVTLCAALSHYCFHTDYIFCLTEEERQKAAELRASLETSIVAPGMVAIYACYAPLYTLKNAKEIGFPVLRDVIKAQIGDYFSLQEIRKTIPLLTQIDQPVSVKVQEQYEEFPYPRWVTLTSPVIDRETQAALGGKKAKILVAGCGTGLTSLWYARAFPDAEVLAVDLSRTSLSYAIGKAAEYGVKNVTFQQADILQLASIDRQFDFISCAGVLHHMEDPVRGWKVLCGLLKPDGIMKIALYSSKARWAVVRAREVIARDGYTPDADSMRAFRKKTPELLDGATVKNLTAFPDYWSLSMYRDLLFHVQEHRFDIPDLKRVLQALGLTFECFFAHPETHALYDERFPGDAAHNNLDHWDAVEKDNPAIFQHMYQFWCRKR